MQLCQGPRIVQTYAGTAVIASFRSGAVELIVAFEDFLNLVRRNPRTRVADIYFQTAAQLGVIKSIKPYSNRASARCEFKRVGEQIVVDFHYFVGIGGSEAVIFQTVEGKAYLLAGGMVGESL